MAKKIPVKRASGVRDEYAKVGVKRYYEQHAADYRNPHERQVRELIARNHRQFDCSSVLDLACGSGEITKVLDELGYKDITGMDPYTCALYEERTGYSCSAMSFEDILKGKLAGKFATIICSYGLHLIEESKLPALVELLLQHASTIVIITPHKRPQLERYGLELAYEDAVLTDKEKRIHLKVYRRHTSPDAEI